MAPWRLGHAGGSSLHLPEAYKPLVEPASAPVLAAAVSSIKAANRLEQLTVNCCNHVNRHSDFGNCNQWLEKISETGLSK